MSGRWFPAAGSGHLMAHCFSRPSFKARAWSSVAASDARPFNLTDAAPERRLPYALPVTSTTPPTAQRATRSNSSRGWLSQREHSHSPHMQLLAKGDSALHVCVATHNPVHRSHAGYSVAASAHGYLCRWSFRMRYGMAHGAQRHRHSLLLVVRKTDWSYLVCDSLLPSPRTCHAFSKLPCWLSPIRVLVLLLLGGRFTCLRKGLGRLGMFGIHCWKIIEEEDFQLRNTFCGR